MYVSYAVKASAKPWKSVSNGSSLQWYGGGGSASMSKAWISQSADSLFFYGENGGRWRGELTGIVVIGDVVRKNH